MNVSLTKERLVQPKVEVHTTTGLNAGALWPYIEGQADLHGVELTGSLDKFKEHLRADKIRSNTNGHMRLLNCRIYTLDDKEVGYVMFNPAFDSEGQFGFYMEDIFVDEKARGNGVGFKIMQDLAEKAAQDSGVFIKWETDERNTKMLQWSENKLDATDAGEINLDATPLLGAKLNFSENSYTSKPISLYDARDLNIMGIQSTQPAKVSDGALPLVGFLTRENEASSSPVAVTFASLNYSTFGTTWGINLEPPKMRSGMSVEQNKQVVASIIKAIGEYKIPAGEFPANVENLDTSISHLRWHSKQDSAAHEILTEHYNLKARVMSNDMPSTMVLRIMDNNAVERVAAALDMN